MRGGSGCRGGQRPAPVGFEPAGGLWDALGLAEGGEWARDALCAQTDPEAFFPEKGRSNAAAKRVCLACPVRAECLDAALSRPERFGVWGGLSERERRRLQPRVEGLPAGSAGEVA